MALSKVNIHVSKSTHTAKAANSFTLACALCSAVQCAGRYVGVARYDRLVAVLGSQEEEEVEEEQEEEQKEQEVEKEEKNNNTLTVSHLCRENRVITKTQKTFRQPC